MILFCHFLEEYTVEIIDETIKDDAFDAAIYIDGLEEKFYCRLQLPTGEIKVQRGFYHDRVERFKEKLLPMYDAIRALINYYRESKYQNEYMHMTFRLHLIDPNLQLMQFVSPFDRASFEVGKYYFVHCNLHDMYYDETALYRYTGFEFVNDAGGVLNWSHVLDMELYEYARVYIARVFNNPQAARINEALSEYHVIKIGKPAIRELIKSDHFEREIFNRVERKNIYRLKLIGMPVDEHSRYIYIKAEVAAVDNPNEIKLSVSFIDPSDMRSITYPRADKKFSFKQFKQLMTYFKEDAQSRAQDFLINFAGLARGVKIEMSRYERR